MSYVDEMIERVVAKNPAEPEFHQAVKEVLNSLRPVIEKNEELYRKEALLERLTEPERIVSFRVPWVGRQGPGTGKPRLPRTVLQRHLAPTRADSASHPSVYQGIIKFLGFEQIFKNALTGPSHRRRQGWL